MYDVIYFHRETIAKNILLRNIIIYPVIFLGMWKHIFVATWYAGVLAFRNSKSVVKFYWSGLERMEAEGYMGKHIFINFN